MTSLKDRLSEADRLTTDRKGDPADVWHVRLQVAQYNTCQRGGCYADQPGHELEDVMKLLFPDACWTREIVSGALFLYFHDEKLGFTLHPSVSTFLTGIDPFDFIRFVEDRKPDWLPSFSGFVRSWKFYRSSLERTSELLEPLRGTGYATIWLSYPRGSAAWQSARELLASSDLEIAEIATLIDQFSASDELFSHIFFEMYLELCERHRSVEEIMSLGTATAHPEHVQEQVQVDWSALYGYCDELFRATELPTILTTAYMFRLPFRKNKPAILLSNPQLVRFLASLPIEFQLALEEHRGKVDLDVVAWEFFRQLISPHVDPLEEKIVKKITLIRQRHTAEIDALKRRCLGLALDLGEERDLEELQKRIAQHIRGKVSGEVQAVLSLDRKAVDELLDSVFSDEKTWIGTAAFLYSLIHGGPVLTAGAAIFALSSIGSKAVKAAATQRQKLEVNDYALLYRMQSKSDRYATHA